MNKPTPPLMLPPEEAEALRMAYDEAGVILEYGSGGSTVMAAQLPGKTVFSVESDPSWHRHLADLFRAAPPAAQVVLHHADIGRTRDWGYPDGTQNAARWPGYAVSVWDRLDFRHPDVVLIDGRFRAACFLTTLFRITHPVTVLWDDYKDRDRYHFVEDFCPLTGMVGRMAIFTAQPMAIPAEKLGLILTTFLRPQ
ncbi:hypothetical protein [Paenirhodobacter sp.]|uniref:hypothetical protein n=1 Tax=Paenirhodobacter sp. TaxID=1965326 RepID=UPI003B40E1B9